MSELADFLLVRLTEDEADASMALGPCDCAMEGFPLQHGIRCIERFMAECDAKRQIIKLHHQYRNVCSHCVDPRNPPVHRELWPCESMRLLALPYEDHPDYRKEWRP